MNGSCMRKQARCVCMCKIKCAVRRLCCIPFTQTRSFAHSHTLTTSLCCFSAANESAVLIFSICVCRMPISLCNVSIECKCVCLLHVCVSKRSRKKYQNITESSRLYTPVEKMMGYWIFSIYHTVQLAFEWHRQHLKQMNMRATALTYPSMAHKIDIIQWHANAFQSIISRVAFYTTF